MAQDETTGDVNVSGSQGIVAGSGNVQNNTWVAKPTPNLASLSALSPHSAVDRIHRMPYDDVVDLFAGAPPDDVADLLHGLYATDRALLVAILGDIRRDKAEYLTEKTHLRLFHLGRSAEAIALHAKNLGWHQPGKVGHLEFDGTMFFRGYEKGLICWTDKHGAMEIAHTLMAAYGSADFGSPISGDGETIQFFEKGAICLSGQGAIGITGGIFQKWHDSGLRLELPVAAREDFEEYSRQRWEDGTIYESEYGVFCVRSDLAELEAGIPVEDEVEVTSPYGTTGVTQRFSWKSEDYGDWEVMACSSERYGIFSLSGHRPTYYQALGGAESWMGFPVAEQERVRDNAWLQRYEGGVLYYPDGIVPAAVQKATLDMIGEPDGGTILGWPVSEEEPIGTGIDRIQFFEHGAAVLRDGKREILMRPEPAERQPTPTDPALVAAAAGAAPGTDPALAAAAAAAVEDSAPTA